MAQSIATVTAAAKSGGKKGDAGKLRQIRIEFKSNGFEVTVDRIPQKDKNGSPIYEYDMPKDSKVFNEPGEMLAYIEECVGKKESAAHEKAEGDHGKGKAAAPAKGMAMGKGEMAGMMKG